jgi:hypothetical protein
MDDVHEPWEVPRMASIGDVPDPSRLLADYCDPSSSFAWPTYDIDLAPGRLQPVDAVAPSLLSYPIPSKILMRLHAADGSEYARLWTSLERVVAHPGASTSRFDALPREALNAENAEGVWGVVLDAWRAVDKCRGLGMVAVTKILHRKLPELIPIRDSLLDLFYGAESTGELFEAIHRDISAHRQLLDELREPYVANGRAMSRLRAVDIVVWMHQRASAEPRS